MLDIPLWTPDFFKANESECREFLNNPENWRQIPMLNHIPPDEIRDLSLVRFRGMIQDMLDTEFYLEKYEVLIGASSRVEDGRYYDCLPIKRNESVNLDSPLKVFGERRNMFVISIPGINAWTTEYESNITKEIIMKQRKLRADEVTSSGCGQKRPVDDSERMEVDSIQSTENKRIRSTASKNCDSKSNQLLSSEYLLNSPLTDRPSKAVMAKFYTELDSLSLNCVVDFVGFLSINPMLDGASGQLSDFDNPMAHQAANPPPSLIPRLHAVIVKKLDHINPLMDVSLAKSELGEFNAKAVRKDLIIVLTQCLFGDSVAAEYLLSHLISTVYIRTDTQALGQFSVNISNIPGEVLPEYTQQLYEIIEYLLPASHYFPMTLENMNSLQFTPKKDYNTEKLVSGLLQLAAHTHLVLDETRLQIGNLETNGVLGVQSLGYLIKTQQFKCNFEYFDIDFNTDIPVLILSEGKSMLPSDCHIPLRADPDNINLITETMKAAKHYIQPKLNLFRKYLTAARIQNFSMDSSSSEMIQNDFVEMRKCDKKVGADYLNCLLVLSRLLGIARGKNIFDRNSWEIAKDLEAERKKRVEGNTKK